MATKILFNFAFIYPILMSFVWMVGGLYYYLRRERHAPPRTEPPALDPVPFISILVPCYNEADCAAEHSAPRLRSSTRISKSSPSTTAARTIRRPSSTSLPARTQDSG